jgi:hypothetical protein
MPDDRGDLPPTDGVRLVMLRGVFCFDGGVDGTKLTPGGVAFGVVWTLAIVPIDGFFDGLGVDAAMFTLLLVPNGGGDLMGVVPPLPTPPVVDMTRARAGVVVVAFEFVLETFGPPSADAPPAASGEGFAAASKDVVRVSPRLEVTIDGVACGFLVVVGRLVTELAAPPAREDETDEEESREGNFCSGG